MKPFIKKTAVIFGLSSAVLLTACSGGNPLEKESPKTVNTFLKEASAYAELKVNFNLGDRQGYMYLTCMEGLKKPIKGQPDFCPTLYHHMVDYAQQTDGPFKHLTVKQLTDKALFQQRQEEASKHFFSAS